MFFIQDETSPKAPSKFTFYRPGSGFFQLAALSSPFWSTASIHESRAEPDFVTLTSFEHYTGCWLLFILFHQHQERHMHWNYFFLLKVKKKHEHFFCTATITLIESSSSSDKGSIPFSLYISEQVTNIFSEATIHQAKYQNQFIFKGSRSLLWGRRHNNWQFFAGLFSAQIWP
jgi:hypothetical protein